MIFLSIASIVACVAVVPVCGNGSFLYPLFQMFVGFGFVVSVGTTIFLLLKTLAGRRFLKFLWRQKIAIVVISAIIIAGYFLLMIPRSTCLLQEESGVSDVDWLAFRGGPQRTGNVCVDDPDPTSGGINWKYSVETPYYSSPTVVSKMKDGKRNGGYVYAVSAQMTLLKNRGVVSCVDVETGNALWEWSEYGYRATFSSPAVSGKYLVVGEGLHFIRDGRVICLDIETGMKVWEFRTKSHVESSPCIYDGKVYVGAGDDGYYCLKLEPVEAGASELVWHLEGENYPDAETSPIVVDGNVYFGLGIGGKALCCVDALTGEEKWRINTPYPVFSAPTVMDGKLFFGMGNGNYIQTAEEIRSYEIERMREEGMSEAKIKEDAATLGPAGEVWCIDLKDIDAKTGKAKLLWMTDVERTVLGAIAARDGRIYFGSRNKYFYCLDAETGNVIKRWNARGPIVTAAALGKGHVYFVAETGMLYGLDIETFEPVFQVNLDGNDPYDGNGPYTSSPALGNGCVFVGTSGAGLISAGKPKLSR